HARRLRSRQPPARPGRRRRPLRGGRGTCRGHAQDGAPAPLQRAYDTLTAALDVLEAAAPERVDATAVRAMWRLVAVLGFEPSLTACVRDAAAIEPAGDAPVWFSVADGGVLCPRCVQAPSPPPPPPTRFPPPAYRALPALH